MEDINFKYDKESRHQIINCNFNYISTVMLNKLISDRFIVSKVEWTTP